MDVKLKRPIMVDGKVKAEGEVIPVETKHGEQLIKRGIAIADRSVADAAAKAKAEQETKAKSEATKKQNGSK